MFIIIALWEFFHLRQIFTEFELIINVVFPFELAINLLVQLNLVFALNTSDSNVNNCQKRYFNLLQTQYNQPSTRCTFFFNPLRIYSYAFSPISIVTCSLSATKPNSAEIPKSLNPCRESKFAPVCIFLAVFQLLFRDYAFS